MKVYILGICGTFMAGIAVLARELGHQVSGSDSQVYPPMSTQLQAAGIQLREGYAAEDLPLDYDAYVIGNAISRGNPQFELMLEKNLPMISGPQWLYEQVLRDRWVLGVAGTHGKTTTTSMLAWILEYAGLAPGFLIGGVSQQFTESARLGETPFFVIESDEYDTALFDKRSKFVHYHPRTLILNNLEFDHADIFDDLAAIQRQFHHLVRTLPTSARIIVNADEQALSEVIGMGCWSELEYFSERSADSTFTLDDTGFNDLSTENHYDFSIKLSGQFNRLNALAAILAARHAGVSIEVSIEALAKFAGVKRRQEVIADIDGIRIIDDFAHHPTAISGTLSALRATTSGRLIAVVDLRSNTMRMGVHADTLGQSFAAADLVLLCENPDLPWNMHDLAENSSTEVKILPDISSIISSLTDLSRPNDQIVIMSNGGFNNIHRKLIEAFNK